MNASVFKICEKCQYVDPYTRIYKCDECSTILCKRCFYIFKQDNKEVFRIGKRISNCPTCFTSSNNSVESF